MKMQQRFKIAMKKIRALTPKDIRDSMERCGFCESDKTKRINPKGNE